MALVGTATPELVALQPKPDPPPAGVGYATVRVRYISLNRGELHRLREKPAGWLPGWDFAGEVVQTPSSSPAVGQRVCGLLPDGAWAQFLTVPISHMSVVPDDVPLAAAACVPVSGLTAFRVLSKGAPVRGSHILVVGAAGGVGQFAVQLAKAAGSIVYGTTSSSGRARAIAAAGATPVLGDALSDFASRFDLILENSGGRGLEKAFDAVAQRGTIVTFGNSERKDSVIPTSAFYEREARLIGFHLLHDIASNTPALDLQNLLNRLAIGDLAVRHSDPAPWTETTSVLEDLAARRISGKAVLEVVH